MLLLPVGPTARSPLGPGRPGDPSLPATPGRPGGPLKNNRRSGNKNNSISILPFACWSTCGCCALFIISHKISSYIIKSLLTGSPFWPGRPGVPGKPRSPR